MSGIDRGRLAEPRSLGQMSEKPEGQRPVPRSQPTPSQPPTSPP